jgi:hypothetical protein
MSESNYTATRPHDSAACRAHVCGYADAIACVDVPDEPRDLSHGIAAQALDELRLIARSLELHGRVVITSDTTDFRGRRIAALVEAAGREDGVHGWVSGSAIDARSKGSGV